MLRFIILFLTAQLLATTSATVLIADCKFEIDPNSFTLSASDISLPNILEIIHDKTGVTFAIAPNLLNNNKVSINIQSKTIETGLNKLLKSYNKAFIYNDNNQIIKVQLFNRLNSTAEHISEKTDPEIAQITRDQNFLSKEELFTAMDIDISITHTEELIGDDGNLDLVKMLGNTDGKVPDIYPDHSFILSDMIISPSEPLPLELNQ